MKSFTPQWPASKSQETLNTAQGRHSGKFRAGLTDPHSHFLEMLTTWPRHPWPAWLSLDTLRFYTFLHQQNPELSLFPSLNVRGKVEPALPCPALPCSVPLRNWLSRRDLCPPGVLLTACIAKLSHRRLHGSACLPLALHGR